MMQYNPQTSIIDFSDENDYTFNPSGISVSGGSAQLALVGDPDQHFPIDFSSDAGFTYDSDYIEFSGGIAQQLDKRPVNSIIGATFNDSVDASFAAGGFVDSSAILNGTPSIISNKLSCVGVQGISYKDDLIGNLSGNWATKFKYTPNYTTIPATNSNIFAISQESGGSDDVIIFHSPGGGGGVRITANGLPAIPIGAFSPTAGQEYVFEIFCISNVVTLFIDGSQIGTTYTINPAQGTSSNYCHLGAYSTVYNVADGSFADFILYSTASQTTTYDVPEASYVGSVITTPELEYAGVGALLTFDEFTTTEIGTPRYTIQVGRSGEYLYWDGTDWVVSDGSYAQATDSITFDNNSSAIPVESEIYGQFKIHFTNSDSQSSIDELEAVLAAQTYPTTNPTILVNEVFYADLIISLTETAAIPSGSQIKAIIKIGTIWYWYNHISEEWEESDETYTQSNTIAEINTHATGVITERTRLQIKLFLNSDGLVTPTINQIDFTYAFAASTEDSVDICTVYFYAVQADGSVDDSHVYYAKLTPDSVKYKESTLVINDTIQDTPDAQDGYTEFNIIPNLKADESQEMSVPGSTDQPYYQIYKADVVGDRITNDKKICDIVVKNEISTSIWDVIKEEV